MINNLRCQVFDPVDTDETLLKELVIKKINEKREKRKAQKIVLNDALQQTADQYMSVYRYNRFENNNQNKTRFDKKIKKTCQANGYKNAFVDFHIASRNALNYYGSLFYYDPEDSETTTHLFLGAKPSKKEKNKPGYQPTPLKTFTYDELATIIARSFVRDDGYYVSLNNGYDKFGLALAVDKRTVLRNRMPKVKVILIVGGNLITW